MRDSIDWGFEPTCDASACLPKSSVTGSQIVPAAILNSVTESAFRRGLDQYSVQFVEPPHDIGQLSDDRLHLIEPRMQCSRSLEIEIGRRLVPQPLGFP